jgi:hypothetical protein
MKQQLLRRAISAVRHRRLKTSTPATLQFVTTSYNSHNKEVIPEREESL